MTEVAPFPANLVHFGRYLRARGLSIVPQTQADLLEAVAVVGMGQERDFYHALRAVAVSRPEEIPVFDEAYQLFFGPGAPVRLPSSGSDLLELKRLGSVRPVVVETAEPEEPPPDAPDRAGWSSAERLAHRDFADLTPAEVAEVRRVVSSMRWAPARVRSRRLAPAARPGRPDLRRTFRKAVGAEAPLLPLAFSDRRLRRRPLLVVADISGSMERYTEMFLHFIHAARGRLGKVEAFVFSTRLTRITREMRRRDPNTALVEVAHRVEDWSGGTRIGEALETFNRDWSRRVARGGPVALIISDGWDRGDPELLRREMARFSRSVHRVVWLNPLAGRPGYEPEARGMRTVLPYVDDFLAAATLADLADVVRLLESVSERRERP